MIQINLLPDIKAEYIRSKKQKRSVMLLSTIVICASLAVVTILASIVYGAQNLRLNSLADSIEKKSDTLSSTQGLNEILTIQNQLSALDALHADKPALTRLPLYLSQVIPNNAVLDSVTVDLAANTITVSGNTDSLQDVNKLVDTFKFAEISRGEEGEVEGERPKAFSQVVLTGFGREPKNSTFTVTMQYDPAIFLSTEDKIALVVPSIVSTRSTTEQPRVLFGDIEGEGQ